MASPSFIFRLTDLYRELFIDLPTSNSFHRMLTQKLAAYFHLTHLDDVVAGSVRIFRTPFARIPPSIMTLSPDTAMVTRSEQSETSVGEEPEYGDEAEAVVLDKSSKPQNPAKHVNEPTPATLSEPVPAPKPLDVPIVPSVIGKFDAFDEIKLDGPGPILDLSLGTGASTSKSSGALDSWEVNWGTGVRPR
jgi:hypothetical protein